MRDRTNRFQSYSLSLCLGVVALLLLHLGCTSGESNDSLDSDGWGLADTSVVLTTESDSAFEALEELDRGDRENWQKPQMLISLLGDLSDKVVADLGAGTGYFSIPLARQAKKVIAIDIEQPFLDYIKRRVDHAKDDKSINIETRLTQPDDPNLKPEEADLVLVVNTYAYIQNRVAYLSKVREGLKPDGRLVIVDFKKEPLPVGPDVALKLDAKQVSAELDSANFVALKIDYRSLDYQYIITAEKNPNFAQ